MKLCLAAALAAALSPPAFAQDSHTGHAGRQVAAARLNLDIPVEVIVADAAGKAVLEADLPGLTTHEQYNAFKQMSLRQLANYAPDRLTPEALAKVEADLAAIK